MLFQAVCLVALASVQFAYAAPLQDEKIETVKLNHFCMRTQVVGEEHNKSAVVLLHGLTSSYKTWNGVWEVLATKTGRRVCVLDLRNHGDSPWNSRGDVAAMAADIGNFLDSENIQKVNLIGHSLGGKISMHYTLNNPERVNSLVVEDMRPNSVTKQGMTMVTTALKIMQEALKTVPDGSDEDETRKIIVNFINAKMKEIGINEVLDDNTAKGLELRCNDGKCQYKMNIDFFIENSLETVLTPSSGLYEGPALFLYGKKSVIDVPADRENILNLFPNAKLVGVEGAGHVIHGKFREFNDEVIRFLNSLDS